MGASAATNSSNANASNTATNSNNASNFGTNTGSASGTNTVANTANVQGPSQAGQALITSATSPQNTIANTQAFLNPFTQNVLGAQQAIQQQQQGQALSGVAGNAIANNALGGDRVGVAQAQTLGQLQLANNAANAGTLQQGYSQALQAAQNTAGQQLQGAGLSGTQGSTSANTGQLSQQQSQTLGQTQSDTSQAQAQAGVGNGSSTTTQNPGALGYAGLGLGILSDERAKEGVEKIGESFDKQGIYKFRYKGEPETHIGFLAQEVEKHHPEAVHQTGGGLKLVDYDTATREAARAKHFANGGGIGSYDSGGTVGGMVPVTYNGQTIYVPASAVSGASGAAGQASGAGTGAGGLSSLGGPAANSAMQMYNLGSQARTTLGNFLNGTGGSPVSQTLFGSSSAPSAGAGGWQTGTLTSGALGSGGLLNSASQGLSSLGNSVDSGLSSLGDAMGFAQGGATTPSATNVSMPSLASFNSAAAPAPLAGLSPSAFYSPAAAASANPSMPSFAMPSISAPSVAMPTVAQAAMPTVSYPGLDPAISSGKGSGGAVRGLKDGGLARLLQEFAGHGKAPGREDGGASPALLTSDEPLSDYERYVRDPAGYQAAMAEPHAVPATPGEVSPAPLAALAAPAPAEPAAVSAAGPVASPVSLKEAFAPNPDEGSAPAAGLPAAFTAIGAATPAAGPAPAGLSAVAPVKPQEAVTDLSDNGVDYIKSKEGFSANPYSDYRQTSIGYGTKARPGDAGIDAAEAEKRLREEAGKTADFIRSNAKVPLTQNQFDALTSFGYNTGSEPLGKVIADLNKGDTAAATARMQQYINAGGKPLDDLKTRRAEEIALFNGTAGEPGARPSPHVRQALTGAPAQSEGTFAHLANAVKGSPLGQMFGAAPAAGAPSGPLKLFQPGQGGLAGIDFGGLPASLAALSGGPGGMAMAKTMEAYGPQLQLQQQQMELNRQAQAREQAKLLMELATPKVIGQAQTQYIDEYGQPHVTTIPQYGTYDQATNKFPPTPLPASATNASTRKDMDSIPLNVSGDEFVNQAKSMGYSPYHLDVAQKVAEYKDDPSKLYSMKGPDRVIVDRLAHRINQNYDMTRYPAVANAEKNLATGKVSTAISSIGRLFDETSQASDLVDATHNSGYENVNALAGAAYPSKSEYQQAQSRLKTMLNNVVDSASAVAKGGGQAAEGDARRRAGSMNSYMAPATLKGALATEAEVGLKNGQSNLTPYNEAHGYTPDNPKYKTIMDYMTPAQQKRAIAMLGADKIEDITGKPVKREMGNVAPGQAGHSIVTVRNPEEAKAMIAAGKLKSGDQFVDEHGTTRTVH